MFFFLWYVTPQQSFSFVTEQELIITVGGVVIISMSSSLQPSPLPSPIVSNNGAGCVWHVGQSSSQGSDEHLQCEGLVPLRV